jgi:hypothetical protein
MWQAAENIRSLDSAEADRQAWIEEIDRQCRPAMSAVQGDLP